MAEEQVESKPELPASENLSAEILSTVTPSTAGEPVLQSNLSANDVLRMDSVHIGDKTPPQDDGPKKGASASVEIATLVAEHHAVLYRYAYRLTGSMHEAEDLTQQAFLTAQRKLDQLRSGDRARGWLFTILRTCYLKSIRKRRPFNEGSMEFDLAEVADESLTEDSGAAGFDLEGNAIDGEQLQAALNELPDEFRLVLVMYYFEELSYREIAARLDLPAGTVMSRLSRAKGHLRSRLLGHAFQAVKPR